MNKQLLYILSIVIFIGACGDDEEPILNTCADYPEWWNYAFGNPSQASPNPTVDKDNFLVVLPEFSLSYNESKGIPNWVSWYTDEKWIGEAERQDDFAYYDDLPDGWFSPDYDDYRSTGFDRGHNCPSADRTCSQATNTATFWMINMIPQAPNHNRNTWSSLEAFGRELIDEGFEVYNIMGNYGQGGEGSKGFAETIAGGSITVPESIWRVLLVLPLGEDDLSRVDEETRIIAVDIPNTNDASNLPWYDYVTSVDEIEKETGFDLLNMVPESIQAVLEMKVDEGPF